MLGTIRARFVDWEILFCQNCLVIGTHVCQSKHCLRARAISCWFSRKKMYPCGYVVCTLAISVEKEKGKKTRSRESATKVLVLGNFGLIHKTKIYKYKSV